MHVDLNRHRQRSIPRQPHDAPDTCPKNCNSSQSVTGPWSHHFNSVHPDNERQHCCSTNSFWRRWFLRYSRKPQIAISCPASTIEDLLWLDRSPVLALSLSRARITKGGYFEMTPAGVHVGCGCGDGPLLDATPSYVAPWLCGVPLDRLAFGRRLCPGRTLTTPGLTPGFTIIQPTHRKAGTERRPSCGCIHLEDHSDARRDLYWHTECARKSCEREFQPWEADLN